MIPLTRKKNLMKVFLCCMTIANQPNTYQVRMHSSVILQSSGERMNSYYKQASVARIKVTLFQSLGTNAL